MWEVGAHPVDPQVLSPRRSADDERLSECYVCYCQYWWLAAKISRLTNHALLVYKRPTCPKRELRQPPGCLRKKDTPARGTQRCRTAGGQLRVDWGQTPGVGIIASHEIEIHPCAPQSTKGKAWYRGGRMVLAKLCTLQTTALLMCLYAP